MFINNGGKHSPKHHYRAASASTKTQEEVEHAGFVNLLGCLHERKARAARQQAAAAKADFAIHAFALCVILGEKACKMRR